MNNDVMSPKRAAKRSKQTSTETGTGIETFQTPDQVAASDAVLLPVTIAEHPEANNATPSDGSAPGSKQRRFWLRLPYADKRWLSVTILVLAFFGGGGTYLVLHKPVKSAAAIAPKAVVVPKPKVVQPTTVASTLSGLPVALSVNQRTVTAVMVENSIDARPQSGLSQAGIIYEAVAEGGVTRFMALYQDTIPTNVGPVRSARPYYIQWALGYDAGYAHVGGSTDGLADIKAWQVRDLDQFANGGSYHRISTREAPHNVYTGIDTLNQLETAKGYTSSTYTGFSRKVEAPSKQPTATTINFSLSGPVYNPHYVYNAATNSYNRSEYGTAQTDANTGQQLSPKVVVAIVVPETQGALDSSGAYYSDYNALGSGTAYVFQDGTVVTGQWHKASNTAPLSLTDATGKSLALNPGQTWITAVSSASGVSYTP